MAPTSEDPFGDYWIRVGAVRAGGIPIFNGYLPPRSDVIVGKESAATINVPDVEQTVIVLRDGTLVEAVPGATVQAARDGDVHVFSAGNGLPMRSGFQGLKINLPFGIIVFVQYVETEDDAGARADVTEGRWREKHS